jgi:hypothetical protein
MWEGSFVIVLLVTGVVLMFVGVMLFAFRGCVASNLSGTSRDAPRAFPRAGSTRSVAALGIFVALIGIAILVFYVATSS